MPKPILTRRTLIGGLTTAWLATYGSTAVAAATPFTQGVASGDPASDGFVLWTRLAPDPLAVDGLGGMTAPATVRWTVFADDALQKPVASGDVTTDSATAHSVHAEVHGLKADRPYWYHFEALGVQSPAGRARTLPLPTGTPAQLTLAVASCSNYEKGYFSAYRHMTTESPDFILFLGDYIYETSQADPTGLPRRHDRPGEVHDLSGYRNRYALHHLDPDLQALRAASTALMTWDDHEVQNDYGGFLSLNMRDDVTMVARRAAAYQAYYEAMPLRRSSRLIGNHLDLYKSYRFGHLAEIHMLDGRQYRSAAACPVGDSRKTHVAAATCTERLDPSRSMLGQAQENWLYDRFARNDTGWTLLGQDVLMAPFLQKGYTKDGSVVYGHSTDTWDGYPATRDRVLDAMLRTRLKNPVVLSGDLHSFWANDLKRMPDGPTVATEFLGAAITSDGVNYRDFSETLPQNPHVRYFNSRTQGYMSLTLRPDHLETRFMAISDRADRNATVAIEKRFVVESGKPGVIVS